MASSNDAVFDEAGTNLQIHRYKKWLKKQVDRGYYTAAAGDQITGTLSDQNVWGIKAGAPITQSVLDDAFMQQTKVLEYFGQSGITAYGLPTAKSWYEVKQDHEMGFHAYKDALTIRIPYYKMSEMPILLTKTLGLIEGVGGSQHVYHDQYPEIVHFINWYHPEIGHTVQVQVLHMFTLLTLDRDRFVKLSGAGLGHNVKNINLWDDGLFIDVREALLDRDQWINIWHESPRALWLNRLDKLIHQKHQGRPSKEREEDEKLKVRVHETLMSAFFGPGHDIVSIIGPPPSVDKSKDVSNDDGSSCISAVIARR